MGAIALYMQCLANDLESKFTADLASYTSFRNRYTGVWRNAAQISALSGGDYITTGLTNIFWNAPGSPNTGTAGSVTDPYRFNLPGQVAGGAYEIGIYANFVASGTVTVGSTRILAVDTWTPDVVSTSLGEIEGLSVDYTEETNTGGEFLQGSVPIINEQIPYNNVTFTPWIDHNNASTLNIPAGQMMMWAIFIGPGDQVEVS